MRSVKSKDELYAHIRVIREATKKNQFGLEFLDKLPVNSYKIYSDMNRNAFPVQIFKRIQTSTRLNSFEENFKIAYEEKKLYYLTKLVILGKLDNEFSREI
jgi:hypothetical protein